MARPKNFFFLNFIILFVALNTNIAIAINVLPVKFFSLEFSTTFSFIFELTSI